MNVKIQLLVHHYVAYTVIVESRAQISWDESCVGLSNQTLPIIELINVDHAQRLQPLVLNETHHANLDLLAIFHTPLKDHLFNAACLSLVIHCQGRYGAYCRVRHG